MQFSGIQKRFYVSDKRVFRRGFSLVELLIVIGIIAILVGISFTVSSGVMMNRDIALATTEMNVIASKLSEFKNKYRDYPRSNSGSDGEGVILSQALLGQYILVYDKNKEKLVDKIVSDKEAKPLVGNELTIEKVDGDFLILDPWGNPYYYRYEEPYAMDASGKNVGGKWENPGFILISAGPDGVYSGSNWKNGFKDVGINDKTGELEVDDHLADDENKDNLIFGNL